MGLHVFSGSLKGIPLFSSKGTAIRPTSGKVREAVFNILSSRVLSAGVLDLFAGSGALGIEALSRGAQRAVFIDVAPNAVSIIRKNLKRCNLEDRSEVFRRDICVNLNCLTRYPDSFDLVFMDPPYHQGMVLPALKNLKQSPALRTGALVVVEHGAKDPTEQAGYRLVDRRKYGKTLVSFLEYVL